MYCVSILFVRVLNWFDLLALDADVHLRQTGLLERRVLPGGLFLREEQSAGDLTDLPSAVRTIAVFDFFFSDLIFGLPSHNHVCEVEA